MNSCRQLYGAGPQKIEDTNYVSVVFVLSVLKDQIEGNSAEGSSRVNIRGSA